MHALRSRSKIFVFLALLSLVVLAVSVRYAGVHWLVGYGSTSDYSFHPDDYRFIVVAKDFKNPLAKPSGYPLFMPTQLFVIDAFLGNILHVKYNAAVVLRFISLTYAILSILLCYILLNALGFARHICFLSSYFLAFSPLHIILSDVGTADISSFFLFYLTILAAWLNRVSNKDFWFYLAVAVSAVAMADKFFLPSLLPVAVIIFANPTNNIWGRLFLSLCVFVSFYCASSFFNFTPWDLDNLMHMLMYDNLVVTGGKSPLEQIVLYPWDLIACSGAITSGLALIGGLSLLRRFQFARLSRVIKNDEERRGLFSNTAINIRAWLLRPYSVIVLPLLLLVGLIVTAQVHASRHILAFVPIVCVLAAISISNISERFRFTSGPIRAAGALIISAVLIFQFGDGVATERIYQEDIRQGLSEYLTQKKPNVEVGTFSNYTRLNGVSLIETIPTTEMFITCDLEYQRYVLADQGKVVFHPGGTASTLFFAQLFSGRTSYTQVFDIKREKLSIEDLLTENGLLPQIDTFVPNECQAFQRR